MVVPGGEFRLCGKPLWVSCSASLGNTLYIRCLEHSVSIDVDNDGTKATNPVTATHAHVADTWYTESKLNELSRSKLLALF